MRESTRHVHTSRSYQQYTVRRGVLLRLGTRVGLVTASNDHQAFRLTGPLSLARSSLAGAGFHSSLFLKSFFVFVFNFPVALRRLIASRALVWVPDAV